MGFLEALLSTASPTGFEQAGQQVWVDYVKDLSDTIVTDAYGSAAAHLGAEQSDSTVMLEAHCDEIGMMVSYIDNNGFIYVHRLGGSDPSIARARKVYIHNREGVVCGLVGHTAIHLQDKTNKGNLPEWSDLYVDIGAENREQAQSMISVGDPVTLADQHEFLSDELLTGRALDNRIGSYIIARVVEALQQMRHELKVHVIALNAVQEETGGFGARMMAYRYEPHAAFVTDVTHATDIPGLDPKKHGLVHLGKGPVLSYGGANHPTLVGHLENIAQKTGISVQKEAAGTRTGTDADSIFYQKKGIPSALVSLPLRYMHSPVELCSMADTEAVIALLTQSILQLRPEDITGNIAL